MKELQFPPPFVRIKNTYMVNQQGLRGKTFNIHLGQLHAHEYPLMAL